MSHHEKFINMDHLLNEARLKIKELKSELTALQQGQRQDIAIIGISGQFAGSNNVDDFWQLLKDGKEAISSMSPVRRSIVNDYDDDIIHQEIPISRAGWIDDIDQFDAAFFNISPLEARYISPEQRLLLQNTWHAIEHAGLTKEKLETEKTGVFIGISASHYQRLLSEGGDYDQINAYYSSGSALSTAAGRIAYTFNFKGPCLSIDTACSASLHAVHEACQSLKNSECSLAIVGGVNVILTPHESICFAAANMLSPDGKCHTFDERANGYVRGEGCGVIILKWLSRAIDDHDPIIAVIKGSAINQDGSSAGLTVPSGLAQEQVIQDALQSSGINRDDVAYIETHGTGTALGDPIEIKALENIYGKTNRSHLLLVGSVKTNIGHLEAAAGIASIIKLALSLKEKVIPASLNFHHGNHRIDWNNNGIKVVTAIQAWPRTADMAVAGVSSFSFSGSNAHVIMSNYLEKNQDNQDNNTLLYPVLLTLSAKSSDALIELCREYYHFLKDKPLNSVPLILANSTYFRDHFDHRLAIVANNCQEILQKLSCINRCDLETNHHQFLLLDFSIQEFHIEYEFLKELSNYFLPIANVFSVIEETVKNKTFIRLVESRDEKLLSRVYNLCLMHLFKEGKIDFDSIHSESYFPEIAYFKNEISIEQAVNYIINDKIMNGRFFVKPITAINKDSMCITNRMSTTPHYHILNILKTCYKMNRINSFKSIYRQPSRTKIPLYPFQKKQYWIKKTKRHPFSTQKIKLASEKNTTIYQMMINISDHSIWVDHVIYGKIVLPGTALLEIILKTQSDQIEKNTIALSNVKFEQMVTCVRNQKKYLQVHINSNDIVDFKIYSMEENDDWLLNAIGHVEKEKFNLETLNIPILDDIFLAISDPLDIIKFYESFDRLGLSYGKSFQLVEKIWDFETTVIGQISLQKNDGYYMHPALIDSCLHVAGYMLYKLSKEHFFIPVAIEKLKYYSPVNGGVFCIARLDSLIDEKNKNQMYYLNMEIVNPEGIVLVKIERMLLKSIKNNKKKIISEGCILSKEENSRSIKVENIIKEIAGFKLTDELDFRLPLDSIGYDSLMYIQLRNRLLELNISVSTIELIEADSIFDLINTITLLREKDDTFN